MHTCEVLFVEVSASYAEIKSFYILAPSHIYYSYFRGDAINNFETPPVATRN